MSAILTLTMNPAIDVSASTNKVAPIRKIRCSNAQRDPGGGGINVARVVHRFGGDSQALYPAGGLTGRLLHRLLNDEGVANVPIDVAESTRENFSITETTSGDQYRFTLPGAVLREQEWPTCLDRVAALTPPPDYLVASGSLPPGVPVDFYARLARIAGKFGARVVVDTSGPPLAAALEAGVYLVKPNLRELRVLTGLPLTQPSDWEAAAAGIVRSGGADIVALTLGDAGATLVSRDACIRASPLRVKIMSVVGAGDSFLGAMVLRLSSDGDLEDAFRHGVAAGTAALLTLGTDLCRRDDAVRLVQQVELSR